MKNYWLLTRLMLKNTLASMNPLAQGDTDGKNKHSKGRVLLLMMLGLYGVGFLIWFEIQIYKVTATLNNPLLLPGLAILLGMMLTLVLGLFQGLSELYQGKDAPFLAVLPVSSRQCFAARLTSLYVTETVINIPILFPAFILYAVNSGKIFPTVLTAIPVWLLLPVIPLSIVALLSALLMRLSFFSRYREIVVMVLSFAIAITYSIVITRFNSRDVDSAAYFASFASNGLVEGFGRVFPPAAWAANAFNGDVLKLLLLLAVSAAAAAAVIALVGPGYIEQALSSGEQTVTGKGSKSAAAMHTGSIFRALHRTEWRRILRTPAWLFNGMAGVVMYPLMLGIGVVSGFSNAGQDGQLPVLLGMVDPAYIVCFGALLMSMGAMVNPVVSTAVSREGGCWPYALSLPVRQETRFSAKLMVGVEISALCSLLIAIVSWVLTRAHPMVILAAFLLSFLIGLAVDALSLWFDATHPHFRWANENEAIKKNFNQFFGMLFWLIAVALCCVPMFFLFDSPVVLTLLILAIAALMAFGSIWLLYRTAKKMTMMEE